MVAVDPGSLGGGNSLLAKWLSLHVPIPSFVHPLRDPMARSGEAKIWNDPHLRIATFVERVSLSSTTTTIEARHFCGLPLCLIHLHLEVGSYWLM